MNSKAQNNSYQQFLDERTHNGQLRQCLSHQASSSAVEITVNEQTVINFSSNDYLGLSHHPAIIQASTQALQQYGTGTCSSRLITGTTHLTTQLETTLARWLKKEAAIVFPSGYQANISILQALFNKDVLEEEVYVFADRLNHASLVDGMTASKARWQRYRHCDLNHLEHFLKKAPLHANKWIITDSVFSMDGDYPDLNALALLAKQYNAQVFLDEAHGIGVFGNKTSSGLAEHHGVTEDIDLIMGTFSKALGSSGAFVAGNQTLIDYLINTARGFIYTTALPPAVIAANLKAVEIVQQEPHHRETLWKNIEYFQQLSGTVKNSDLNEIHSPIIAIPAKDEALLRLWQEELLSQGYWVHGIRPPTVPQGSQRLRLSLSAAHTTLQIQHLREVLNNLV